MAERRRATRERRSGHAVPRCGARAEPTHALRHCVRVRDGDAHAYGEHHTVVEPDCDIVTGRITNSLGHGLELEHAFGHGYAE